MNTTIIAITIIGLIISTYKVFQYKNNLGSFIFCYFLILSLFYLINLYVCKVYLNNYPFYNLYNLFNYMAINYLLFRMFKNDRRLYLSLIFIILAIYIINIIQLGTIWKPVVTFNLILSFSSIPLIIFTIISSKKSLQDKSKRVTIVILLVFLGSEIINLIYLNSYFDFLINTKAEAIRHRLEFISDVYDLLKYSILITISILNASGNKITKH